MTRRKRYPYPRPLTASLFFVVIFGSLSLALPARTSWDLGQMDVCRLQIQHSFDDALSPSSSSADQINSALHDRRSFSNGETCEREPVLSATTVVWRDTQ